LNNVKMNVVFSKTGDMKYLSHLDLLRLFQRALRRAGLRAALTQGFNPHMRITIKRALKLGLESGGEDADFMLKESISPSDFIKRLNAKLPEGVKVLNAKIE